MNDIELRQYSDNVKKAVNEFLEQRRKNVNKKESIFKPEFLQSIREENNRYTSNNVQKTKRKRINVL